jgi:PAS domain S-box-containing protein
MTFTAISEPTGGIRLADPAWLSTLMTESEDRIIVRVLAYAIGRGYVENTSTLAAAWRASIQGLSQAIAAALAASPLVPELSPHRTPPDDPLTAFGVAEACLHRSRGTPLTPWMGLFKYYRQAYLDEVCEAAEGLMDSRPYCLFVQRCFDRMELAVMAEWMGEDKRAGNAGLRDENRRLANEKNKYLTIFESLNEPVVLVGPDGESVDLNHAAARLLAGRAGGFAYDRRPAVWLDPGLAALLSARQYGEAPVDKVIEAELETADGRRWFEIKIEHMLDVSRKFEGFVFIFSDVTERRLAASILAAEVARQTADLEETNRRLTRLVGEMERSGEDLDRFAYIASHDLQEPLRSISSFAQLLAHRHAEDLPAEARDYIGYIVDGAKRLSALINDLLVYSRVRIQDRSFTEVDCGRAVDEALKALAPAVSHSAADIQVGALPTVWGDADQLAELFLQLLGNALKFVAPGTTPVVRIAATAVAERWRISVEDNGIGVPAGQRDEVFQAFKRLHAYHEVPGTGIGLAVVKRIVERHGGSVWVEDADGGGSRFVVELPAATGTAREEAVPMRMP